MKKLMLCALALTAFVAVAGDGPSLDEARKLSAESGKPILVDLYKEH